MVCSLSSLAPLTKVSLDKVLLPTFSIRAKMSFQRGSKIQQLVGNHTNQSKKLQKKSIRAIPPVSRVVPPESRAIPPVFLVFFFCKTRKIHIGTFFLPYVQLITLTDLINMNYAKLVFIVWLPSKYPVYLATWMPSHMRGMVEDQHLPTCPQFLAFQKSDSQVG